MPGMAYKLRIELEDGTTFDVTADQRDVARWEIQPFGGPLEEAQKRVFTFLRFLGWNAARRQGLTKLDWPTFDDACVDVVDQQVPEGDDQSDPGKPVAQDTPSS